MLKTTFATNSESVVTVRKRKLPHWEWQGSTYFITFTTIPGYNLSDMTKDIVFSSIKYYADKKYRLYTCAVMENHVHSILQPLDKTPAKKRSNSTNYQGLSDSHDVYTLSQITHSIKSYSAHKINKLTGKNGIVWLDETYDRIIRDEKEFLEKLKYIVENPVKAGIVNNPEEYKWLLINL